MSGTDTSALSGIQLTKLVPDIEAHFRVSSDLFNAVETLECGQGETTARFLSRTLPNSQSSHNQTSSLNPSQFSITEVDATLAEYPVYTNLSKLAQKNPRAAQVVIEGIAGNLAVTADNSICGLVAGFSSIEGNLSQSMTLNTIMSASADLDSTGWKGEKVLVLHPQSFVKVANDLLGWSNTKAETILANGYIDTVLGIQIYVSPYVNTATAGLTAYRKNGMYFKWALGLAYMNPIIEFANAWSWQFVSDQIGGISIMAFKEVQDTAGVTIYDTI